MPHGCSVSTQSVIACCAHQGTSCSSAHSRCSTAPQLPHSSARTGPQGLQQHLTRQGSQLVTCKSPPLQPWLSWELRSVQCSDSPFLLRSVSCSSERTGLKWGTAGPSPEEKPLWFMVAGSRGAFCSCASLTVFLSHQLLPEQRQSCSQPILCSCADSWGVTCLKNQQGSCSVFAVFCQLTGAQQMSDSTARSCPTPLYSKCRLSPFQGESGSVSLVPL